MGLTITIEIIIFGSWNMHTTSEVKFTHYYLATSKVTIIVVRILVLDWFIWMRVLNRKLNIENDY